MESKMKEMNMEQMAAVTGGIFILESLWLKVKSMFENGEGDNAPTVVPTQAQ